MTKEKIINGCEFQSDCIEYKDISYLKIMPICAIYELSIACHDKENKCKYYQVYKQLKRLQEENEKQKKQIKDLQVRKDKYYLKNLEYEKEMSYLIQALEEIREIINEQKPPLDRAISQSEFTLERLCVYEEKYIKVVDKINEAFSNE